MSRQRTALDDATRNSVAAEMRKWHFDEVVYAIRHVAYAVPEGKKFSLSDCEEILDELAFDTRFLSVPMTQLKAGGILLEKYDSKFGHISISDGTSGARDVS